MTNAHATQNEIEKRHKIHYVRRYR